MNEKKIQNIFGALALAISDDLLKNSQQHVPLSAPAASIALISHAPGISIEQLSRALGLSHPGAVRLVDRLESEKLLERRRAPHDARALALHLTEKGEMMAQNILESRQTVLAKALASLSLQEQALLGKLTETMLHALVKSESQALEVCRLCDPSVCVDCPVTAEVVAQAAQSDGHEPQ